MDGQYITIDGHRYKRMVEKKIQVPDHGRKAIAEKIVYAKI